MSGLATVLYGAALLGLAWGIGGALAGRAELRFPAGFAVIGSAMLCLGWAGWFTSGPIALALACCLPVAAWGYTRAAHRR